MATVSAGVNLVRRSVEEATSEVAQLADRLTGALRAAGIGDDAVQTSNYSLGPEYDHRQTPRQLVGYRANNTVTVAVLDLDTISAVLRAAAEAGGDAITIDRLAFDHADPTAILSEARALAWADAEATARQLAELAGRTLGPARRIEERSDTPPGGPQLFRAAAMAESAPPIEPGAIERAVALAVEFTFDE
jgi:uncharacterized protein YggE